MKKISNFFESASEEDLMKRIKLDETLTPLLTNTLAVLNNEKAKNALLLTAIFATNSSIGEIKDEFRVMLTMLSATDGVVSYISNVIIKNKAADEAEDWKKQVDGTKECVWIIYRTYLAKTLAKVTNDSNLDDCNMFLRTFKNSWEKSWKEIETAVKNMNENTLPDLENVATQEPEITNQEQDAAVETAIEDEDKLLKELIARAGLNKKQLKDYVTLIINKSFKEADDNQLLAWKKKIAKDEPVDNKFVLGLSAMICGAVITGNKTLAKDLFKYLDAKAQDDLLQAQNKLLK